jgi:hypothetical protein
MQTYKTFRPVFLALLLGAGCATSDKPHVTLRIHEEVSSSLPPIYAQPIELPKLNLRLTINPYPSMSEKDILSAERYVTPGGNAVLLHFDPQGALRLDELTTRTRSQYLVIFINGRPVSAWLVDKRLNSGAMLVEGDFSESEAKTMIEELNKIGKKNAAR